MRNSPRWWAGIMAIVALGGCRQTPFGRVEGVLVEDGSQARPVESGVRGKLAVTRNGEESQGRPDMSLKKGDALVTGPDGIGMMVLAGDYRIIMDPGTELTLENPSVFVRLGRIIVKKIGEVREGLRVRTELGVAAVEGTEFVLEVNRGQEVQVTVLDGQVKIYPAERLAWRDTLTYVAGNRGRLDSTRFEWLAPLSASGLDSLRRRIRHLEIAAGSEVADVMGPPGAGSGNGDSADRGAISDAPTGTHDANVLWAMTAEQYRGRNGQRFSFQCPARSTQRRVWGTGVYTDDSSVCTAALHAGALGVGEGGTIVVEILPGKDAYEASTQNGITTGRWDRWGGSFRILNANATDQPGNSALLLVGTGKEHYVVHDSMGRLLTGSRATNSAMELPPGTYTVILNNSRQRVNVVPDRQTVVRAGTVMLAGTGKEEYTVYDSTGQGRVTWGRATNSVVELLPGTYILKAGDRHFRVRVRPGQQTKVDPLSSPSGTPGKQAGGGQPR